LRVRGSLYPNGPTHCSFAHAVPALSPNTPVSGIRVRKARQNRQAALRRIVPMKVVAPIERGRLHRAIAERVTKQPMHRLCEKIRTPKWAEQPPFHRSE